MHSTKMSSIKKQRKIIVILGPTSSGKSDLAVKLALQLRSGQAREYNIAGAEIISADSRQVYKNLNIGSGKITKKEMKGIPHYLLDISSPKKVFTAINFQKLGNNAIKKIYAKHKIPIICGGTGFYIDSLIYNYNLPKVPPQKKLRKKLEKLETKELFEKLNQLDQRRAKTIDKNNRHRLIRALEIIITTKKPIPEIPEKKTNLDILKLGIAIPKNKLKEKIKRRLVKRLRQGMVNEVKNLHKNGLSWKRLEELGLEHRYVSRYLQGKITKEELIKTLKKENIRYAKRQMTWFKQDKNIIWIKNQKQGLALIQKFLKN